MSLRHEVGRWARVVKFMPRPLYPPPLSPRKEPMYLLSGLVLESVWRRKIPDYPGRTWYNIEILPFPFHFSTPPAIVWPIRGWFLETGRRTCALGAKNVWAVRCLDSQARTWTEVTWVRDCVCVCVCVCVRARARTVTRCSIVYKTTKVVTGWDENMNLIRLGRKMQWNGEPVWNLAV